MQPRKTGKILCWFVSTSGGLRAFEGG